jgi:hypothetical protein
MQLQITLKSYSYCQKNDLGQSFLEDQVIAAPSASNERIVAVLSLVLERNRFNKQKNIRTTSLNLSKSLLNRYEPK